MFGLFKKLICEHDWELIAKTNWLDAQGYHLSTVWVYRCKKCCKSKKLNDKR